jgi:hypothetical protein
VNPAGTWLQQEVETEKSNFEDELS